MGERRYTDEEVAAIFRIATEEPQSLPVRTVGSLRERTNGNLQALLEPSGTGHRLRLRTQKESARVSTVTGLAMIAFAGVIAAASALGGAAGNTLTALAPGQPA